MMVGHGFEARNQFPYDMVSENDTSRGHFPAHTVSTQFSLDRFVNWAEPGVEPTLF